MKVCLGLFLAILLGVAVIWVLFGQAIAIWWSQNWWIAAIIILVIVVGFVFYIRLGGELRAETEKKRST